MNIIDAICLTLVLIFLWMGWNKGFFQTIKGPLSLLIAGVGAYIYYQTTQNFFMSVGIAVFGSLILGLLFSLLIRVSRGPDEELTFISQAAGAVMNASWHSATIILMLILIPLVPIPANAFSDIQEKIKKSFSYKMAWRVLDADTAEKAKALTSLTHSGQTAQSIPEYKNIIEDKKIQAVITDEQLVADIKRGDFLKVSQDPRIQQIMNDPALIKKMLKLQHELAEKDSEKK